MSRYITIVVLIFGCWTIMSCQSYSSGLQQSVTRADETAAIAALHTISVSQRTYSVSNNGNYGTFAQLVKGGYLDSRFDADKPNVKGYVLTMNVPGEGAYNCSADPEGAGPQAVGRHFYLDSASGQIHVNPTQAATASDPTLGQ